MLATRLYFANALGAIEYVPEAFVYLRWTDHPATSPEMRALYVHTRNLLATSHLSCLLADHRAMAAPPTPTDKNWLLTHWLPETVAGTPYKRYAVLPAPAPANRLHNATMLAQVRQLVSVALFEDMEAATAWLLGGDTNAHLQV